MDIQRSTTRSSIKPGFTLIELMIVIAVIAILAALAYPAYRQQIIKSRRSDAKVTLTGIAEQLERCFPDNNTYVGCATASVNSPEGYYTIATNLTAANYNLVASPVGAQADDTGCTTISLNQFGSKTATGSEATSCW